MHGSKLEGKLSLLSFLEERREVVSSDAASGANLHATIGH